MALLILLAVPAILLFAGLGLAMSPAHNFIVGKVLFEIREYERGIVYRFGKFHRLIEPGWKLVIPVIENFTKYDLRTESVDIAPQEVITKDGVRLNIDATLYLRVEDPEKAEFEVEADYRKAVENHVKGRIRNVIGGLKLEELYADIEQINERLKTETAALVEQWGVNVVGLELQKVTPPLEVVEAMEAREIAGKYREAADENAKASIIKIKAIEEGAGNMSKSALNYMYIQALKDIADGRSSKIIFPMEFTKLAEGIGKGMEGKEGEISALAEKYLGTK